MFNDLLNDSKFVDEFLRTAMRTRDAGPILSDAEQIVKRRLLLRAAWKPVRRMTQVDVFTHATEDDVVHPDKDGDAVFHGQLYGLHNSDCLRVQFPANMRRADVIRALQRAWETVNEESFWEFQDSERMGHLDGCATGCQLKRLLNSDGVMPGVVTRVG